MNILMVCMGNICRSPLAEGILKKKLADHNIKKEVIVDSAGMESFHIGDSPDCRAQQIAKKYGIDISAHRARLFQKKDFDSFDKIYVMDSMNYRDVLYFARNESDKEKIDFLMNELFPGTNKSVPDPWYGGMEDFEIAYQMINSVCKNIVKKIAENH